MSFISCQLSGQLRILLQAWWGLASWAGLLCEHPLTSALVGSPSKAPWYRDSHGAVCVVVGGKRESLGAVRIHFRRGRWAAALDAHVGRGASLLLLSVHS